MTRRPSTRAWLGLILYCVLFSGPGCVRRSGLPAALTDKEFWALIEAVSEPAGTFNVTENFVSNERRFAENIRRLQSTGGVYVGVGPEQNFSYIAGLRPRIAFIVDIRRENLNLHLLYKALFELSSDRTDFISRLFSRPCPPGLESSATIEEVFTRYDAVPPSPEQYDRTRMLIHDRLLKTRLVGHHGHRIALLQTKKPPLEEWDLEVTLSAAFGHAAHQRCAILNPSMS